MLKPEFFILYVADPAASAQFYQELLGCPPVAALPMFVEFDLAGGMKLGLWAKQDAQPVPAAAGGGAELAFTVQGRDAVDAAHTEVLRRGTPVIQSPVDMDFAYTFVLCDPDGHRLRVCAPNPM